MAFTRGNEALIDQINKGGGLLVGGKRYLIKYFKYDNKRDPATSVQNTKQLVFSDKVNFIFHHGATAVVPTLPTLSENKIVSMDISVGSQVLGWPYNFDILTAGPFRSDQSFKAFVKNYGIKTAVEINGDNESGYSCDADDRTAAKQNGVKILSDLFFPAGTTDFYPILTKAIAARPDMLVLGLPNPGDVPLIVKQARELSWTGPIGMTQGSAEPAANLVQIAGAAAEGFVWTNPWHSDPNYWTKEEQDWANYWKANFTEPFIADSFGGCKQIALLTQAIQKADSLDPDKIAQALETNDFVVQGWKIHFGAVAGCYMGRPRSLVSPLYMMTIKGGQEVVSQVLIPEGVEKVQ